ncbi:MAG: hypothetical protein FWH29_04295 [Methanobrevibacter sp.]|nr:hypothetical protein [Methanobrevibacter sp.]MCL2156656.1 hypothetical protein [Methanobrevibacter sp.]
MEYISSTHDSFEYDQKIAISTTAIKSVIAPNNQIISCFYNQIIYSYGK